jgi:hypothetical protein
MLAACRGAKDVSVKEAFKAEIAKMRDPLNLIGIMPA